jgi:hypothetical protein
MEYGWTIRPFYETVYNVPEVKDIFSYFFNRG